MKVFVLSENSAFLPQFGSEHGLSLLVEKNISGFKADKGTDGSKGLANSQVEYILIDTGASDLFRQNAEILGREQAPLSRVDYLVLTHGHADHCGGLSGFLQENTHAKIYLHEDVCKKGYYSLHPDGIHNIGLDPNVERAALKQLLRCSAPEVKLPDGDILFQVKRHDLAWPDDNGSLYTGKRPVSKDGELPPLSELERDSFTHEYNLLVKNSDGKNVLFCGCAHNGILNILDRACELLGGVYPDICIGGAHLAGRKAAQVVNPEGILEFARDLAQLPVARYYLGHCTGAANFEVMRTVLGERLESLGAGRVIEI